MRTELKCKIIKKYNLEEVEKGKKEVLKLSFIAAERNPKNKNSKPIYCICYGNIAQEIEDDYIDGEVYFDLYGDISVSSKEITVETSAVLNAKDLFEAFGLDINDKDKDAEVEIPSEAIVEVDRVLFYVKEYENSVVIQNKNEELEELLENEGDDKEDEEDNVIDISSMSSSLLDNL